MKKLNLRETFKPMYWKELDNNWSNSVLESHMFLKKNRDGKTKGQTVAGGKKQRHYISNEDYSSTYVATSYLLLRCIIDVE